MRIIPLLIISSLYIFTNIVKSQDYGLGWVKSMGSINSDASAGSSITYDRKGNIYVTGVYENTVDFDPGIGVTNLISNGKSDFFIQKLDSLGNFLWAKSIGGSGYDNSYSIITDSLDNIYLIGWFENTVDFDPGNGITSLSSNGERDFFILKLNEYGNIVWVKSIGGLDSDIVRSINLDLLGYIYITGYFSNTVDFDPGIGVTNITSKGGCDIFALKLDSFGNLVWVKSIGGTGTAASMASTIDLSNNIYLTGWYTGTVDFDPSSNIYNISSNGDIDIFILNLDSSGNFLWVKSIGDSNRDEVWSITTDLDGNHVYLTGRFKGTVDFDPGNSIYNLSSMGYYDAFILKLDYLGNFIWAKSLGGPNWDYGNVITINSKGNIYISGGFSDTVVFDQGNGYTTLECNGNADIFIGEIDVLGNFIWVKGIGGVGSQDICTSLIANDANDIYLTGSFQNTVDFDPNIGITNLTAIGFRDIYIAKLTPIQLSTTEINISNISVYPNPTTAIINIDLINVYSDVHVNIINSEGKLIQQHQLINGPNIHCEIEGSNGIYFLEIICNKAKSVIVKVIKQ